MNGKAAQLERWLEAIRQRVLVQSGELLGQVACNAGELADDGTRRYDHEYCAAAGIACPSCGAAV